MAANYIAFARVLADSWAAHHPSAPFFVLVIDVATAEVGDADFELLVPEDLGIDAGELRIEQGIYGPLELCTALKPPLMRTVLRRGFEVVVFLDADTEVYGELGELAVAAATHGVALTPHVLAPYPLDESSPTELEVQATGVFNGGLLAVSAAAHEFLDWWQSRLRRDCVLDGRRGLFVDQRFLDWVPSLFAHIVVRDPAINVAFWNLHERTLSMSATGPLIDGDTLRHFHFSGFDPRFPTLISTYELKYSRPLRITTRSTPALIPLCARYSERLLAAGYLESTEQAYGLLHSASGIRLGKWERAVYREAVVMAERHDRPLPPSPYSAADSLRFENLLTLPSGLDGLPAVTRARLECLRGTLEEGSRRLPSSKHRRALGKLKRSVKLLLDRELAPAVAVWRLEVDDSNDALIELLADIERRLGEPVALTGENP